jgi:hypothetical protein
MGFSTIIGSLGVALLLVAFFLNLFIIHYMPFVILEGTWCLVAIAAFVKKMAASGK